MEPLTFILSDESVNDYGFRILTAGIDIERFMKNPIMLYVHIRGFERNSGDPLLPIGRWDNIRKVNGQLLADAVFDEEDDFAMKIAKKVKKRMLNTASIHADIIELSEDPTFMIPGQTMPTITKCVMKEASIADIPGNANAVRLNYEGVSVKLGLQDSNPQDLSKLFSHNKPKHEESMKQVILKLNGLKLGVSLSDTATEAEVLSAIDALVQKNIALTSAASENQNTINQLNTQITKLTADAQAAEVKALDDKAIALADGAVAAKKIMPAQKDLYVKLAKSDYDSTKQILDGMKGYEKVSTQLSSDIADDEDDVEKLKAEHIKLHNEGKLQALKLSNPEKFKKLHKARYGTEPKL